MNKFGANGARVCVYINICCHFFSAIIMKIGKCICFMLLICSVQRPFVGLT